MGTTSSTSSKASVLVRTDRLNYVSGDIVTGFAYIMVNEPVESDGVHVPRFLCFCAALPLYCRQKQISFSYYDFIFRGYKFRALKDAACVLGCFCGSAVTCFV